MYKKWKKFGALFLIITLVAVTCSACIGGGEEETTVPPIVITSMPNVIPADMDAAWMQVFSTTDFDGDGVLYPDDLFLGRDDNEVDGSLAGGTYKIMTAEISDWDPIEVTDTASDGIVSKIYSGLVQYVPGTTDPMPDLAVAWEVNAAGDVYTFYLRQDLTFTNGEAFTSEDIVFSWDRLSNPVYASPRIGFLTDYVESYQALGDYVFEVTLKDPFAPFITLMTYTCFKVLPKDYVSLHESVGETVEEGVIKTWLFEPNGTGPWTLNEYVPGDHVTLDAKSDYWAGRPYLDHWNERFVEEDDTIVQAWKAGQIDVSGVPSAYWEEFNTSYGDTLLTISELATYFMYFHCGAWPFDSLAMRQAVTMGIERASVIQTIFQGRFMPAHGVLPPGMFGFSQELYDAYDYTFNPTRAMQILDDAGIVDTNDDGIREYQGQELKFELSSYVSGTYEEASKVWIDNLLDLGMEMTYQQYDFGTLLQSADEGEYTLMTLGWIADFPDPENFHMLFETSKIPDPNSSRYSDPQLDAWVQELRTNPIPEERRQIAYNIEQKLQVDCPYLWFYHSRDTHAVHTWVHGYAKGPMGEHVEKQLGIYLDAERGAY